jgi:hypothetical protein
MTQTPMRESRALRDVLFDGVMRSLGLHNTATVLDLARALERRIGSSMWRHLGVLAAHARDRLSVPRSDEDAELMRILDDDDVESIECDFCGEAVPLGQISFHLNARGKVDVWYAELSPLIQACPACREAHFQSNPSGSHEAATDSA